MPEPADDTPPDAPFTPVAEVGEFGLIDRLRDRLGEWASARDLVVGIGDDAAVYRVGGAGAGGAARVHVVTTDALVEGVHFDRTFVPLRALGWKAVAVNVSDVAAMNAAPRFATIALGLPNNLSVEGAEALYTGVACLAAFALIQADVWATAHGAASAPWALAGVAVATVGPLAALVVGLSRTGAELERQQAA